MVNKPSVNVEEEPSIVLKDGFFSVNSDNMELAMVSGTEARLNEGCHCATSFRKEEIYFSTSWP